MESLRDLDLFGGEYVTEHLAVAVLMSWTCWQNPGSGFMLYDFFQPLQREKRVTYKGTESQKSHRKDYRKLRNSQRCSVTNGESKWTERY